ncbi:MAG: glutamine synthetase family protein [Chitinophagales bacterium]
MTTLQILDYVKNHSSQKVKVAVTDIDGVLRGKYMSAEKFLSVADSDFGFCDVVFGWDANDVAYDNCEYTGWHTGYPDAKARIDLSTFRKIPWENDVPFFLGDFVNQSNEALHVCPRQLLKKVIMQAEEAGFAPYFSQEFEWFNFEETPQSLQEKNFSRLQPLTPGMFGYSILRSTYRNDFFNALFEGMKNFNVPLEGLHTETGPGVYEAAITYSTPLLAADRAVLFKTATKEIAYKHGIMATFMAKVSENLPGCSGHVHQSLWDKTSSKNLFHDTDDKRAMSEMMKHYIAGQLYCLPEILPMLAPTVNSYKRLVEGAWAPTTITWAVDNRTVALRALPGGSKSSRLETRVVGSDSNPYLAMAACLAAGLYGIERKLRLQKPTVGNGYRDYKYGSLPRNLFEATQAMDQSKVARKLFGNDFVNHFTQTRYWEWKQFSRSVTDWETKRYLEII